jgi:hypothetical protein
MSPRGLLALLLLGVLVLVFAVLAVALVELRSHRTVSRERDRRESFGSLDSTNIRAS